MWCRSNAHLPASCGLERSTWCQTTVKRGLELSHRAIDSVLLKLPVQSPPRPPQCPDFGKGTQKRATTSYGRWEDNGFILSDVICLSVPVSSFCFLDKKQKGGRNIFLYLFSSALV